ncbi:MAG: hypothetical protein M3447_09055 [Acidobacteriota bacterium]|nr:hypothetical protein [Acidobacteriota bacterium]
MAFVKPDKPVQTRTGEVLLGDGNTYLSVRIGFGPRGDKLSELTSSVLENRNATEPTILTQMRLDWAEIFRLALQPLYTDERIESLLDTCAFSFEHMSALLSVLRGWDIPVEDDDEPSKKNDSPGLISQTPTSA